MTSIRRWATAAAVLGIAALGTPAPSWAACSIPTGLFDFDFRPGDYPDCFRNLVRGGGIKAGTDVGPTGHTSLNISGSAGTAGASWLTIVDQAPDNPDQDNIFGSEIVCADVLIQRFDNTKGAGIVTLFNQGAGKRGLALVLYDAGNTDRLALVTVDGDPAQQGKVAPITSVPLGSLIEENAWYRILFTVLVDGPPQITGQVFRHATPSDPNSATTQIGPTLVYTPEALPEGVSTLGQNGLLGSAFNAVVNSSITNFTNIAANCLSSGGPATAR